jgi:hypothetical protein
MSNPLRALAWKFFKALVHRHFPDVPSIPIDKLAAWLMGDMSPPVLIDVRQREEYEVSHLPNALHLPTSEAIQKDRTSLLCASFCRLVYPLMTFYFGQSIR